MFSCVCNILILIYVRKYYLGVFHFHFVLNAIKWDIHFYFTLCIDFIYLFRKPMRESLVIRVEKQKKNS